MQVYRMIVAVAAAVLLLAATPLSAEYTIEQLVDDAGLREGPTAMRDVSSWDPSRVVLVRDIGLELPDFDGFNVVAVPSLEEALTQAGSAGAIIGFCNDELLEAAPRQLGSDLFGRRRPLCHVTEVREWRGRTDKHAENVRTCHRRACHCDDACPVAQIASVYGGQGEW